MDTFEFSRVVRNLHDGIEMPHQYAYNVSADGMTEVLVDETTRTKYVRDVMADRIVSKLVTTHNNVM